MHNVWTPHTLVNEKTSKEVTGFHLQGINFRRMLATAGQSASFHNVLDKIPLHKSTNCVLLFLHTG